MITIRNISKIYHKKHIALQDINLSIGKGLFGLLGPNGAGKTTLIRILATLLHPSSGDVEMNKISLTKNPERIRTFIGYLPQSAHIFPQLSGFEFLDYVGVMKGLNQKKERLEQVERILSGVNLLSVANKKIKTYSGGMRQRLGIAQALLGDPQILIVDEPTAGLDPQERVRFRNLLSRLSSDRSVLLSTHIVADIENSCNELAVLNQGRLVLNGKLEDLRSYAMNQVWELELSDEEINEFPAWQVVSTKRNEDGSMLKLRVISNKQPNDSAISVSPTLEDGYIALLGGRYDE